MDGADGMDSMILGPLPAGKVARCMTFGKTGSLIVNVALSPYRLCAGEAGEHGTFATLRATATCSVVGTGTSTILIQVDSDSTFASPVTVFTIALDMALEATVTVVTNAWDWASGDIWVRAYPSPVGATAPQDTEVQFWYTEAVWA
jgi:hypothetical protein